MHADYSTCILYTIFVNVSQTLWVTWVGWTTQTKKPHWCSGIPGFIKMSMVNFFSFSRRLYMWRRKRRERKSLRAEFLSELLLIGLIQLPERRRYFLSESPLFNPMQIILPELDYRYCKQCAANLRNVGEMGAVFSWLLTWIKIIHPHITFLKQPLEIEGFDWNRAVKPHNKKCQETNKYHLLICQ